MVFAVANVKEPVLLEAEVLTNPRSVADFPNLTNNRSHIVTGQVDWRFSGQKLSYVGGYIRAHSINLTDGDATGQLLFSQTIASGNAGYRTVSYVDPREFQFTLRYSFGSR